MLESLITSKTRIKLLLKFFLNSNTTAHLRGLESEFGESTNAIRLELNRFEQAGLLVAHNQGNRKMFSANTAHPLYNDINQLVRKHLGIDQLVEQVLTRLGEVKKVYLTGDFAHGQDSSDIDILLVGGQVDTNYLERLIERAGSLIRRKVKYSLISDRQFEELAASLGNQDLLLLWQQNN